MGGEENPVGRNAEHELLWKHGALNIVVVHLLGIEEIVLRGVDAVWRLVERPVQHLRGVLSGGMAMYVQPYYTSFYMSHVS